MAWAAVAAAARPLLAGAAKNVGKAVVGSMLTSGGGNKEKGGSSLSVRQQSSGTSIGQNPGQQYHGFGK
jgi:hypothetical protein